MLPKLREMVKYYVEGATEGAIVGMFRYATLPEIQAAVSEYRHEIQQQQLALGELMNSLKGYEQIKRALDEHKGDRSCL